MVERLLTFDADEVSRRGGASCTWIDSEQVVPIRKGLDFQARIQSRDANDLTWYHRRRFLNRERIWRAIM